MTLSKLIMISANKTFPILLMYEGSLPFLVVGFTFLMSINLFLNHLQSKLIINHQNFYKIKFK